MPNIFCNSFLVAGTKYRCELANLRSFTEDSTLMLRREPSNPHDTNAIAVYANIQSKMSEPTWLHVGYVPAALAKYLSPMMAEGLKLSAIARRIDPPKLVVWAELVWEKEDSAAVHDVDEFYVDDGYNDSLDEEGDD